MVPRRKPEFLSALRETQQGSYLLHEGGYFLESLAAGERKDAADYLFSQLVLDRNLPAAFDEAARTRWRRTVRLGTDATARLR